MNKKTVIIILLMTALVIFGLSSCLSNKGFNEIRNARDSLDWAGVYTGTVIRSGNGHADNVRIRLYRDNSIEFTYQYADGSYNPINFKASFKWDDTGNIIMTDVMDAPAQYKVEKNRLIRLNDNNQVLDKVR